MSFLTQKTKPLLLAIAALSLTMAASCELPAADGVINFELTGQVLDFDTKQPIEGAYVLAVYEKVDIGLGGTARYCVKTKGMSSDKEGRFHFPVEKLDNNSPSMVFAIKPDHYFHLFEIGTPRVQKAQTKETYSNRHVYLRKQDPKEPEFKNEFTGCERPQSPDAIEAALIYMDMKIREETKFGKDIRSVDSLKNLMESMKQKVEKQIYK